MVSEAIKQCEVSLARIPKLGSSQRGKAILYGVYRPIKHVTQSASLFDSCPASVSLGS